MLRDASCDQALKRSIKFSRAAKCAAGTVFTIVGDSSSVLHERIVERRKRRIELGGRRKRFLGSFCSSRWTIAASGADIIVSSWRREGRAASHGPRQSRPANPT